MTPQLDLIPEPSGAASDVEEHATEKDWLIARRSAIGASEAPIILGVSPFKRPMELFAEKLEVVERDAETDGMRWGKILEGPVAEHYAAVTGRRLRDPGRYTLRRSRAVPWMVATLDREIVSAPYDLLDPATGMRTPTERQVPAPLEIKTTVFRAEDWTDEPPVDVLVQVQHQLAVTGWAWASVAVLIAGRTFRWYDVPRHEPFITKLIEAELVFLAHLRTKTLPRIDGTPGTKAALRALYPQETPGLVVNLPAEGMEWDTQRLRAIAELKICEEIKDEAENKLRAALGEAEMGVLPDGTTYTYKASERKGYVVQPTVVRTLRRKEAKPF
jgi:putative phage-type endonuclease